MIILKKTMNQSSKKKKNKIKKENDETIKKIIDVLDTKIRPAVARDGGDIKFKSFEKWCCQSRITRKLLWMP